MVDTLFGVSPVHYTDYGTAPGDYGQAPSGSQAPTGTSSKFASNFENVRSMEELEAEFRAATREITEVVIHWTANFMDQYDVDAYTIDRIHKTRGFIGIGYHYIIKRDGTLQRGRPLNLVGAHAGANGPSRYGATTNHNLYSIGISHVAGYISNSSDRNQKIDPDGRSITAAQYATQRDLLDVFYKVNPIGQVIGHQQASDSGKVDPGFDVDTYIYNNFNKTNVYQYRSKRNGALDIGPPLSREQLIAARAGDLPYDYPIMPYAPLTS